MSGIRQGQVYWPDFGPAAGSAPADRHPCVVVQNDVFNRSAIATAVVCLITSNLTRAKAPGDVLLKKGEAGLSMDNTELAGYAGKFERLVRRRRSRRAASSV